MDVRVLSPDISSRIAAGEVVERPASVVKELVENALDAGATRIDIECRSGGIDFICVADDGSGIPSHQAELAFERHATSKIRTLDDLVNVGSLGFRGEALPSIAAVSDVELSSKAREESLGTYLYIHAGRVTHSELRPRASGTTIAVRRLFKHFPARLKFLKSQGTENSHNAQVVTQYALAYPGVAFSLLLEDKRALRTPGSGTLRDVVAGIYGLEMARALIPIESSADGVRITGLAGPASLSRSGRNHQSTFVNHRWVRSPLLQRAIEEAYKGLLPDGRNAVAFIDIEMPPNLVDVNVHPSKAQVKFADEQRIFRSVRDALNSAVREGPVAAPAHLVSPPASAFSQSMWSVSESAPFAQSYAPGPSTSSQGSKGLPPLRILGQVRTTYIVAEGPDGLYIIDQHAAHERVVYDRLSQQRAGAKPEVQGLLEPLTIEFTPAESTTLANLLPGLNELGFQMEPFGGHSYLLRSVPAPLAEMNAEDAMRRIIQDMRSEAARAGRDRLLESVACHSAVRAGQPLSFEEMRELVRQLEQTYEPRTCPHGRPTVIVLDSPHLERLFARRP